MKKNSTPNRSGSTGIDNDNPKSIPNPSRFIDKGVKNAIKNSTLSKEKRYNINTPNTKGSANIK